MTGLATLQAEGLPLLPGPGSSVAELLAWHPVSDTHLPDADLTVLMWVVDADLTADWYAGWWDGEAWRDAASGGQVAGWVSHWADPAGPAA